jgi:hypothetical protein
MLQQLAADGVVVVGDPTELLGRSDTGGLLIQAPNLILVNGVCISFSGSNCFSMPQYDVSYATASSVKGPFMKSSALVMVMNDPLTVCQMSRVGRVE